MRLYLVRHTEAARGGPDDVRPLTPEGRRAARALGGRLAAEGARPQAVLSSPLLRARETAAALAQALGCEVETEERLGPGASADGVREAIAAYDEEVVIVGHQPDCGRIAAELGGGPEPAFPPGGVAVLEL